jgi:Tfp pilus assembly protein PilF
MLHRDIRLGGWAMKQGVVSRLLRTRWIQVAFAVCLALGLTGVWLLLHPGGLWLQPWRPERTELTSRFIFGPYPLEKDFMALEKRGVTTIVSLLDPSLPYEAILLDQERELARKHGMEVLDFPMASILGQSFGKDYVANSKRAAQAAIDSKGVAYIHCYLGLHRSRYVQQFLKEYAATTNYKGTLESGRSDDVLALDRANIAFVGGRHDEALRELASIRVKTVPATLLEGWANYRLGNMEAARVSFAKAAAERPDSADAQGGLGYTALRSGDLETAGRQFERVLAIHPDDIQALQGLGYVRQRQGRVAAAKSLFERVLKQDPDNAEAREALEML